MSPDFDTYDINVHEAYRYRRREIRAELETCGMTENIEPTINRKMTREGWTELGSRSDYDLIMTVRFRPGSNINDFRAAERFREFHRRKMRAVYGPRWSNIISKDIPRFAVFERGEEVPHWHVYIALESINIRTKEDAILRFNKFAEATWRKLVTGGSLHGPEAVKDSSKGLRYFTKSLGLTTADRVIFSF